MANNDITLFDLQEISNQFASVRRHHYIPGTNTHESDVEHSFTVAILCWYIVDSRKLPLNLAKVMQYSLVHDLAEVHAGDTHTFAAKKDREAKILKEAKALTKLEKQLPTFPTIIEMAKNMSISKMMKLYLYGL
jgi:5'-deoxynucleotidase YfbR-like HD superfamily hydrolase